MRMLSAAAAVVLLAACATDNEQRAPVVSVKALGPLRIEKVLVTAMPQSGADPQLVDLVQTDLKGRFTGIENAPPVRLEINIVEARNAGDMSRGIWGILATKDKVAARVMVRDRNGRLLDEFDVAREALLGEQGLFGTGGHAAAQARGIAEEIVAALAARK